MKVPLGTIIRDNKTTEIIAEMIDIDHSVVVARGGIGGKGNAAIRMKGEKQGSGCTPPTGGAKRWLSLELKLVADIGLVGVPNAGKSTLLAALTNANPKIASYPFTTLIPNMGVCFVDKDLDRAMVVADIPGE